MSGCYKIPIGAVPQATPGFIPSAIVQGPCCNTIYIEAIPCTDGPASVWIPLNAVPSYPYNIKAGSTCYVVSEGNTQTATPSGIILLTWTETSGCDDLVCTGDDGPPDDDPTPCDTDLLDDAYKQINCIRVTGEFWQQDFDIDCVTPIGSPHLLTTFDIILKNTFISVYPSYHDFAGSGNTGEAAGAELRWMNLDGTCSWFFGNMPGYASGLTQDLRKFTGIKPIGNYAGNESPVDCDNSIFIKNAVCVDATCP